MKFYRNNIEIYDIRPEDRSAQRVVHMGENVLNLTFRTTSPLDIRVNDFTIFEDEKYKLKNLVNPRRLSRHEYEYTCKMYSPQYDLQDALYVLEDNTGVGILDDTIPLFGTALFHLQQIVKCVRVIHPEWNIGDVEKSSAGMSIVYSEMDCLQALQHLCSEANLEYWFTGTTISLGKKNFGTPIPFRYGKGNALYELSRTNQDGRIVTKLLVKGSDRNIDSSSYGSKNLHLPNNERYVEQNIDKFGPIMGRINFPEVFPRLIHKKASDPGIVTSVRVDDDGIYFIKDANLDFEPELLPGKNLVVDFQTGQLGGVKIDANWHSKTREYELITGEYGLGMDIPAGGYVPSVGDLYLLSDLKMPQAYIDAAERELLEKALEAITGMCEQKVSYKGPVNPLYFRQLNERIQTGRNVIVTDNEIVDGGGSVELRVQSFTRGINDDLSIEIEISDTIYISRIDRIEQELKEVKEDANERIQYGKAYTERRWRDAEETLEMLKNAQLDFTEAINPITVQTMQLLVGDKSLQFRFVNSKTTPVAIDYAITYNDNTKILRCPTAILQHMTLGINTLSSSHLPGEYKFWDMSLFESVPLTESSKKYYLYARVSTAGTTGTFLLSETSIKMEQVAGYYHLLAGLLNSEFEGIRSFVSMYGFTEITPGQMRIDKIISADGKTYFNLAQGEIGGKITFTSGTTGYNNIVDKPDVTGQINNASNNLLTYINGAFADGIIDEAEALNIQLYLNVLAAEKTNIDAGYTSLYSNNLLTGTPKTNLYNAKMSLNTTYTNLVNYINTAIADGTITDTEKAYVDHYYTLYRTALSTYSTRYEEAHASINSVISSKATDALTAAEAASNAANAAANTANGAATTASGKATVYYNTSTSYYPTGLKTNDLLCTGTEIYRYNGSSWVLVSEFYNTKTVINGGLISTGALTVGTSETSGTGGIAGGGTIRIWSGGSVTSGTTAPSSATFTVDSSGVVRSKNSFIVHDANGQEAAGFTSVGTTEADGTSLSTFIQQPGSTRMWVGGVYASRENALFKVYMGGMVQMAGFMLSNLASKPSSIDTTGIFAVYDEVRTNGVYNYQRSRQGNNSILIDNGMGDTVMSPYVDIKRASSTSGSPAVSITATKGTAAIIRGGLLHFDYPVKDPSYDILLGNSNVFVLSSNTSRTLTLPRRSYLELDYGDSMFYSSIELFIVVASGSSGTFTIVGTTEGCLFNNSGGWQGGASPGKITLTKGNCLTLRWIWDGWYIMSFRN